MNVEAGDVISQFIIKNSDDSEDVKLIKNEEKKLSLFGYLINDEVQVHIKSRSVMRLYNNVGFDIFVDESNNNHLKLRDTMMRLFLYLLSHADEKYVSNQELMTYVWEQHNLSSSSVRLSQVISELKSKLLRIGMATDFIKMSRGRGYTLQGNQIAPLYVLKTDNNIR